MEISYQLTELDYRQGYKAFRTRTKYLLWKRRVSYVVFAVLVVTAFYVSVFGPDRSFPNLLLLWGLVAFLSWCYWGAPRYAARKIIGGSPGASLPHTADISENGLSFKTSASEGRLTWDLIVGWAESDGVFVLLPSPMTFLPIPKRAMIDDQQVELRSLLQRKVVKRS